MHASDPAVKGLRDTQFHDVDRLPGSAADAELLVAAAGRVVEVARPAGIQTEGTHDIGGDVSDVGLAEGTDELGPIRSPHLGIPASRFVALLPSRSLDLLKLWWPTLRRSLSFAGVVVLEEAGGDAFVVAADELVGSAHGGAVGGEPVEGPDAFLGA